MNYEIFPRKEGCSKYRRNLLLQRKYIMELLEEIGILDCKLIDTPTESRGKLKLVDGNPIDVGKSKTCGKANLSLSHSA